MTGGGQTPARMCASFCFAAVASRLVTRFGAAPLIRGSATDTRDAQPDSSRRGTPSEPQNSGTAPLLVTTGELTLPLPQSCRVCLSKLSLWCSLHSSPRLLSPIIVPLPPSLCNHILNTIGSQSNLMHRYSLIKLICGDPLLQSVLHPHARLVPYATPPHTHTRPTLPSSALQSTQNATHFAKMLLLIIS